MIFLPSVAAILAADDKNPGSDFVLDPSGQPIDKSALLERVFKTGL